MTKELQARDRAQPLISLRGISKAFPGVQANDRIDLDIYPGQVHALLGENGAGKSVLMKILYGFYRADAGEIRIKGQPVSVHSPQEARQHKIGMVFQNLSLIPVFTVWENIALFLPDLARVVKARDVESRIRQISDKYGLQVDPGALVSQISIGERQKVEILKLLLSDAKVLILDEPTHVLAPHEVEAFFQVLHSLRQDGYAIILITHKMSDVLKMADHISVLRGGRLAGSLPREEATEEKLIQLMFDKAVGGLHFKEEAERGADTLSVLTLENISTQEGEGTCLKDVNLMIHPGEILGVAGVSGNGQTELCDVILGIRKSVAGRKLLDGSDHTNNSVRAMREDKTAFIPENPMAMAAAPLMTVLENLSLTKTKRYARRGGLRMDWVAVKQDAEASSKRLGLQVPLYKPARTLSGGNLQRMVIIREMEDDPELIIASYLTRGLDVQSALAARQALVQAKERGAAILLVSEDLDELFALSDRLVVLFAGQVVGQFRPQDTNAYEVGRLMTGGEIHDGATV